MAIIVKKRTIFIGYIIIICFALLPLFFTAIGTLLESLAECESLHPLETPVCYFFGIDIGSFIANLYLFHWFLIPTVFIGSVLLIIWTIFALNTTTFQGIINTLHIILGTTIEFTRAARPLYKTVLL